jgi:hypothetical protein
VIRKEPASVSVPAGPPSQRFHNPTFFDCLKIAESAEFISPKNLATRDEPNARG